MAVRSDPWRYESPCCGGFSWQPNARGDYRCRWCGEHFDRLRDRKTGNLAGTVQ